LAVSISVSTLAFPGLSYARADQAAESEPADTQQSSPLLPRRVLIIALHRRSLLRGAILLFLGLVILLLMIEFLECLQDLIGRRFRRDESGSQLFADLGSNRPVVEAVREIAWESFGQRRSRRPESGDVLLSLREAADFRAPSLPMEMLGTRKWFRDIRKKRISSSQFLVSVISSGLSVSMESCEISAACVR
jgi:hypothetical protein